MSGHRYAPAPLYARYPWHRRLGEPHRLEGKSFASARDRTPVQFVVKTLYWPSYPSSSVTFLLMWPSKRLITILKLSLLGILFRFALKITCLSWSITCDLHANCRLRKWTQRHIHWQMPLLLPRFWIWSSRPWTTNSCGKAQMKVCSCFHIKAKYLTYLKSALRIT
jgi:hypothetical protein